MIVDSMTHTEVYAELAKEREAVTRWWRHQLADQRRRALKCRQFPYHIWKEYTSTRKNRYLFFSRIFDKKMRKILKDEGVICRYRKSAEKIEMMVRRFEEDGFTSYWL